MIFSSLQYLLFLPVVAVLYWRTRGTTRLWLVTIASYFFYMSWLPVYGILLFAMTTLNWALGLAIDSVRERRKELLKPLLALGLIGNLGCLVYYKYTNFFLSNLIDAINWLGVNVGSHPLLASWTTIHVILPLGISFFVFEFVHYIVDIYRGDKPIKSWLEFAAFAAFFPSQIAGPIKRFQEFMDYLRKPLPWSSELFNEAGTLICQGLFKKVAIADLLGGAIANSYTQAAVLSSPDALIASIGFCIQVYCDFSGYTDIGRGSALLLGIRLPENFQLPYLAPNLADFWRRWHMSLSFWLRDYVYFPLGGSRTGRWINSRNLFLTMVACGLWHGADWHYVLFGCIQGMGLIVHREWRSFWHSTEALRQIADASWNKYLGIVGTMLFTIVTYPIFRAPDATIAWKVISSSFSPDMTCSVWEPLQKTGVLWFLGIYFAFWLVTEATKKLVWRGSPVPAMVYPSAIRFASWTAATFLMVAARPLVATPFVYFQF